MQCPVKIDSGTRGREQILCGNSGLHRDGDALDLAGGQARLRHGQEVLVRLEAGLIGLFQKGLCCFQLFAGCRFHLNGYAVSHDNAHFPVFQLAQLRDDPLFRPCQAKLILPLHLAAPFTVRSKTKNRAPQIWPHGQRRIERLCCSAAVTAQAQDSTQRI